MRIVLKVVLFAFLSSGTTRATIWHVDSPDQRIQEAIDSAASGDTVRVAPGHYHERLSINNMTLTLTSWILDDGDTLFIPQTILDGDSLGTVVTYNAGGSHRVVIDGFTIRGGLGSEDQGGGIHTSDSASVVLRNLWLTRNFSNFVGAVVFTSPGDAIQSFVPRRILLENITISQNNGNSNRHSVFIYGRNLVTIRKFVITNESSAVLRCASKDSILVDGIDVSDCDSLRNTAVTIGIGSAIDPLRSIIDVRDVRFAGNRFKRNGMFIGGDCSVRLANMEFADNQQYEIRENGEQGILLTVTYMRWIDADSLVFLRNRGLLQSSCAFGISSYSLFPNYVGGTVRNILVEGCTLGDGDPIGWPRYMAFARYCDLENITFQNNRIVLSPAGDDGHLGVYGARFFDVVGGEAFDSLHFEDLRFIDNELVDMDDYGSTRSYAANQGRLLGMRIEDCQSAEISGLVFEGNRLANVAPERVYSGVVDDVQNIGSVMYIETVPSNNAYHWTTHMEDLAFRQNDDGGLRVLSRRPIEIRDVRMVDMSRQALDIDCRYTLLGGGTLVLENALIENCSPVEAIPIRSEQMPLRLQVDVSGLVRNVTVVSSTTPYVTMAGWTNDDESPVPRIVYENCLFADNEFDQFEAEVPNYSFIPGTDCFRPGQFDNCLLPVAPQYGSDNLVGLAPFWDEELGPPYLDPTSPLVDSGRDDPDWRDLADPENLDFALWPSHGTTRADIGITGGPHALSVDQDWVPVIERPLPRRPAALALGAPWPNPFNPTARIAYELPGPATVTLSVHDLLGRRIVMLDVGSRAAGRHEVEIDGSGWASGLYFLTLEAAGRSATAKAMLLR